MSDRKDTVRRGFVGAGLLSGLLGVGFVVFEGVTPVSLFVVGWLGLAGALLVVAGVRERVPIGGSAVGWPKLGAVGLGVLALGSTTLGFTQLLIGTGGWQLANGVIMLLVGLYLVFVALECWLGGVRMDPETFTIE
jgi:hypothetical protein